MTGPAATICLKTMLENRNISNVTLWWKPCGFLIQCCLYPKCIRIAKGLLNPPNAGLSSRFWFIRSGVGSENLHSWPSPRSCGCCQFRYHTLRMTPLTMVKQCHNWSLDGKVLTFELQVYRLETVNISWPTSGWGYSLSFHQVFLGRYVLILEFYFCLE